MTAVALRRAASADLDAIVALEAAGFAEGAWSAASVRGALADPHGLSLVAVGEDGVVGVILGQVLFERAELLRVTVPRTLRRAGLGRRLLRAFAVACAEAGAEALWLEVRESNTAARTLYEAEGFVLSSRRRGYFGGLEDALLYVRALSAPPG